MTFQFTSQHRLFIQRMLESQEQEQKGYELLLAKPYFVEFFDHLRDAGLFDASRAPGPIPSEDPGSVRIPFWAPLNYLESCAKHSGEVGDLALAEKVLGVVRSCSSNSDATGNPIHNYHTSRVFASILGLLPTTAVTNVDITLIDRWLSDPYDRGLVCSELDKGLITKLLSSDISDDWHKTVAILSYCTRLIPGRSDDEYITVADDYWLKDLLAHHVTSYGEKVGRAVSDVFLDRLNQLFGGAKRSKLGYMYRPAVGDHPQNQDWRGAENRCVEGLRDVLIAWINVAPDAALNYVEQLLESQLGIAKRIALHVINHRWDVCSPLFLESISNNLFVVELTHEVYQLLSFRFNEISATHQDLVLQSIERIFVSDKIENAERHKRVEQRRWLSAIQGKGNERADQWFAELGQGDLAVGVSSHPDFHYYMESHWGDGDSPYQVEEVLAFAREGVLIDRLNGFQQTNKWEGPSTKALVNTLEAAVAASPTEFLSDLDQFLRAKRSYQYGLISGLKQAWDREQTSPSEIDWRKAWPQILLFLDDLISPAEFWDEPIPADSDWVPDRNWIPPVVAELLRVGVRSDEHAYSAALLPVARSLIDTLLVRAEACDAPSDDPMTAAINSPKGKAIEAMFSHALRQCRVCDVVDKDHSACWAEMERIFDRELAGTKGQNFEFSTLAAAYLPNLEYLSKHWLTTHVKEIFREEYADNFDAAIGGLAYADATKSNYLMLLDAGIIDAAQRRYKGKAKFEDRLVERIALAYLWGVEELRSPRFDWWFASDDVAALRVVSHFFWSVRNQELSDTQVVRILDFWRVCVDYSQTRLDLCKTLLSSLGRLIGYLENISDENEIRLILIASHAHTAHNQDWFIRDLGHLSLASPHAACRIINKALDAHLPTFDFQDEIKSVIRNIASLSSKENALRLIDRLRHIQGMSELFDEVSNVGYG
jgi:hypothetical protein